MKVLIIKLNYQYIIQVYTIHQSYYQTVLFKHIVRLMRCFHRNFFTHFLRFWCCNNLAMRKVICKKKIHNPPCLRPNLDLSRLSQLQWINGKFLSLVGTTHQSISINYNLFSPLHFKAYHSWLPFEKKFFVRNAEGELLHNLCHVLALSPMKNGCLSLRLHKNYKSFKMSPIRRDSK